MECEDTCRCYADYDTPYPHNEQTCGTRKKGYIIQCKTKYEFYTKKETNSKLRFSNI